MHASHLKCLLSAFLIGTLLILVATQSFAMQNAVPQQQQSVHSQAEMSAGVKNLQTKVNARMKTYHANPKNTVIPKNTAEINSIYAKGPSERHATQTEREVLIKGLMSTAGIHGLAMPLHLPSQAERALLSLGIQNHYSVIETIDGLARDYFSASSVQTTDTRYAALTKLSGLSADTINDWLGDTRSKLAIGTRADERHWWDQSKCDRALNGEISAVAQDTLNEIPTPVIAHQDIHVDVPVTNAASTVQQIYIPSAEEQVRLDQIKGKIARGWVSEWGANEVLWHAAAHGYQGIVTYLLSDAVPVATRPTQYGVSNALSEAAAHGHQSIVTYLLPHHDTSAIYPYQVNWALEGAAANGHQGIVTYLLSDAVPVAIRPMQHGVNRALESAEKHGHQDIITYLLTKASISPTQDAVNMALSRAAQTAHQDIITYLLTSADIPEAIRPTQDGVNMALKGAACYDNQGIIIYLLTSPDIKTMRPTQDAVDSAFRIALSSGHQDIVIYLLTSPDIETMRPMQDAIDSAFRIALRSDRQDIVIYLLTSPYIATIRPTQDIIDTAYREAIDSNHQDVITVLKPYASPDYSSENPLQPLDNERLAPPIVSLRDFMNKICQEFSDPNNQYYRVNEYTNDEQVWNIQNLDALGAFVQGGEYKWSNALLHPKHIENSDGRITVIYGIVKKDGKKFDLILRRDW